MKNVFILLLLVLAFNAKAQMDIGIEGSISLFNDLDEIMYIDQSFSYGGEFGINLYMPIINEKLVIESGLLFYDYYYQLRGPMYSVWFTEQYGTFFNLNENINDFGLNMPLSICYSKKMIQPFIGAQFQYSLSKNRLHEEILGDRTFEVPRLLYIKGSDIIELTPFTWYLTVGSYFKLSPKLRMKLNYALGMNDFVSHSISPKIVNGVNEGGTTTQTTRIQKFQLSAVYLPNWKSIGKKFGKPNRSVKERFKELYQ